MNSHSQLPRSERDIWDKLEVGAKVAVPLILFALTTVYSCYEREENSSTAKIQAMTGFLPFLGDSADPTQRQVATRALYQLGYEDLGTAAVRSLVTSATTQGDTAAAAVVTALAQKGSSDSPHNAAAERLISDARNGLEQLRADDDKETAIVTGGYGSLQRAQAATDSMRARSLAASVYHRHSQYRTAIRFPNRVAARESLPSVREFRRNAYMVDWHEWCNDPTSNGDLTECKPGPPERIVH